MTMPSEKPDGFQTASIVFEPILRLFFGFVGAAARYADTELFEFAVKVCTLQTDLLRHAAHILAFLSDMVLKVAALDFFPQFTQRHIEIEAADDFCRRRVFLLTQNHGNSLIVHFFAIRFQHDVFHRFGKLVVIARPIVLAQNHQRAIAEFYRLDFLTFRPNRS